MKKTNIGRSIEKLFLKIKIYLDFFTVISVLGILLYRIDALRKICRKISLYISTWYLDVSLEYIKNIYLNIERIFRIIIVIFLVTEILQWMWGVIWDWWLKNQNGRNRFENSLFRYLRDSSIPRCFLVTGEWGSGKTYDVQNFFDQYFRYSGTKIFRISCFGIDSRKEIIKEINNTIEQNDKSFYTLVIKVLQFVPIIGSPIEKFLKKTYGYDTIKKGSIFIFDDFERITSRSIRNRESGKLYRKSTSLLSNATRGRNTFSEFKEIKDEFESVGKAFYKIEDFFTNNLEQSDIDKYNIVIGLINDIIETYEMKVIIICNSEMLGEKFVHDILRSKLNCIEYKKIVSPLAKRGMIDECLSNIVFEDTEKFNLIGKYLNQYVKNNLDNTILSLQFHILRLFGSLLEAFICTANMFDTRDLTNEFMNSLFNSVMITHWGFYNGNISSLGEFPTGGNIEFLMQLFYGTSIDLIRMNNTNEDIKWIDINISGYWILNLSIPENSKDIVEKWRTYKYNKTEMLLCEGKNNLLKSQKFNLLHFFYFLKQSDPNKEELEYKKWIDIALKQYDLRKIEVIQNIVDTMAEIFSGRIYEKMYAYLFEQLIQDHENEEVIGNSYIHDMYNTYRKKRVLYDY